MMKVTKAQLFCQGVEVGGVEEGRTRGGRSDNCEYKDCRWDGQRNDEISFVSDVS